MRNRDYICQVGHRNTDLLNCKHYEGGGYQCERTGPHTGHWIGPHTVEHVLSGNGYACSAIEDYLDPQLVLW